MAEFLEEHLWDPASKQLKRSFRKQPSDVEGFADDYAHLIGTEPQARVMFLVVKLMQSCKAEPCNSLGKHSYCCNLAICTELCLPRLATVSLAADGLQSTVTGLLLFLQHLALAIVLDTVTRDGSAPDCACRRPAEAVRDHWLSEVAELGPGAAEHHG